MSQTFEVGAKVSLKPGSPSYLHFVDYMSVKGEIIKIDNQHYHVKHLRPFLVRFEDEREAWYAARELVLL